MARCRPFAALICRRVHGRSADSEPVTAPLRPNARLTLFLLALWQGRRPPRQRWPVLECWPLQSRSRLAGHTLLQTALPRLHAGLAGRTLLRVLARPGRLGRLLRAAPPPLRTLPR